MNKVVMKESSARNLFYHRRGEQCTIDAKSISEVSKKSFVVRLDSLRKQNGRLHLAAATVLCNPSPSVRSRLNVFFANDVVDRLRLQAGSVVKIDPPWYLIANASGIPYLVRTHFCRIVSNPDVLDAACDSQVELTLSSNRKLNQSVETDLFQSMESDEISLHPSAPPVEESCSSGILQGIQCALFGRRSFSHFQATVCRVFILGSNTCSTVQLLVHDGSHFALLRLDSSNKTEKELISLEGREGQCRFLEFTEKRQRLNGNPLFAIIDSVQRGHANEAQPATFYFVLKSSSLVSTELIVNDSQSRRRSIHLLSLAEIGQLNSKKEIRVNFVAKVLKSFKKVNSEHRLLLVTDPSLVARSRPFVAILLAPNTPLELAAVSIFQDVSLRRGQLVVDKLSRVLCDAGELFDDVTVAEWSEVGRVNVKVSL